MTPAADTGPACLAGPDPDRRQAYLVGLNYDGDMEVVPATEAGVARLANIVFEPCSDE